MEKKTPREFYRKLKREGLGVFRGTKKEIPLPPEKMESLVLDLSPPRPQNLFFPLEVLSGREREVVDCLFFGGLSERETSSLLHLSRSSVRSYRKSALQKLKRAMEKNPTPFPKKKRR